MSILRAAYNLYLLDHNIELQTRLLWRLRNRNQFHGAYYEMFVAAANHSGEAAPQAGSGMGAR